MKTLNFCIDPQSVVILYNEQILCKVQTENHIN